jgi:hypothetical protein
MPLSYIEMTITLIKRHIIITTSYYKNKKHLELLKTSLHYYFILLKN